MLEYAPASRVRKASGGGAVAASVREWRRASTSHHRPETTATSNSVVRTRKGNSISSAETVHCLLDYSKNSVVVSKNRVRTIQDEDHNLDQDAGSVRHPITLHHHP